MADPKIRIRATDETGPAFRSAGNNMESLSSSAARLAGTLGGTLAVAAFGALIKGAIDADDELAKLSQRTGIAIDVLGGLGFASDMAGGSLESITDAADKLNRQLAEAASGQKLASEAFKALGISATDAAGRTKSVDVAVVEIADKFASFAVGPEKAALAMRLFGKAGADQIVLLNGGGAALAEAIEYHKRYSGVTEETAKRSEVFNDTLSKIGLLSSSLGQSMASSLLPSLQAVADEFLRMKEEGGGFNIVGDAVRVVFETLAITAANLKFVLVSMGREIGAIAAQAVALGKLDIKGFNAISEAVKEDGRLARAELDALERRIRGIGLSSPDDQSEAEARRLGLTKPPGDKRAAPRLPGSGSATSAAKDLDLTNKSLSSYLKNLETTLERTQDLSEADQALAFLRREGAGATLEESSRLVALAREIDQVNALKKATEEQKIADREVEDARARAAALSLASLDQQIRENDTLVEHNRTLAQQVEEMGLTEAALVALRLARLDETIAAEQSNLVNARSLEGNEMEIAQIERRIRLKQTERGLVAAAGDRSVAIEAEQQAKAYADTLHSDVKSALSNAFRDSKNPALAFAEGLGNVVYTRLTNSLGNAMADLLVGTGAPGASGGLFGGLLGFLPKFAGGIDYVPYDMPAIIHKGERVVTAADNRTGGGAPNVTLQLTQYHGNFVSPQELARNNDQLVRTIQAGMHRSQNYGGALGT